ncbi:TIGR03862 family flavoprotein [Actibacterium ureilyticum]|uniref:TIGR03862 family flavoprotein n=1 Tax=Actibacterium ureilyticum TaxID=1590614 RepID=UPI000BAAF9A8|nr:TIGR03862 family flavoprotein [Actibacterium ureilyticum]
MTDALIIGAGPAGLMAAQALAEAGRQVVIVDRMPSAGRKFLMAGKSGLNLTKAEPFAEFLSAYGAAAGDLEPMLRAFGPDQVQDWARGLGQELFTGSSGRVFPKVMKASPLLRAWMGRLAAKGVRLQTRWTWTGWQGDATTFDTPDGPVQMTPAVTVLALGGASWARLGSDGHWAGILQGAGVTPAPFRPANVGLRVDWSPHMARHFGSPVKGTVLQAGDTRVRAEYVISRRGLEGGGIYAVSAAVRDGAPLLIDLLPDWPADRVAERLARPQGKASLTNHLRKVLKLDPARLALLMEFRPAGRLIAEVIKALPIRHTGPRPLDEAISTAGGIPFAALDEGLMLRARPGVFCAGEMLDWEAPTGGYLLTACLATGLWAGRGALNLGKFESWLEPQ